MCDVLLLTVTFVFADGKLVPLSPEASQRARDEAARWLYVATFDFLVSQCNRLGSRLGDTVVLSALASSDSATITVAELFGFENAQYNSLEQLTANFTHERVEQLFCDILFKQEVRY